MAPAGTADASANHIAAIVVRRRVVILAALPRG
jgi:hypothetical protein